VQKRAAAPITIPRELRPIIGVALVDYLTAQSHCVLAISVSGRHAHILVELPDDMQAIRAIIGEAKRKSSRAVKCQMPGRVWAAGGDYDLVDSRSHQRNSFFYILEKQGPGAWTWSYREAVSRALEAET
jgi:REP element-mobilizing transposase RayT